MVAIVMAVMIQGAATATMQEQEGVWIPMPDAPATMGSGGSMTACGSQIYLIPGGGSTAFWHFMPSRQAWLPLANLPAPATSGTAMTSDGVAVWAVIASMLCRYDVDENAWDQVSPLPMPAGAGACMADDLDALWIVRGGNSKVGWSWRKSDGAWLPWTLPYVAWHGAAMVRLHDNLHLLRGFNSDDRLLYNIPSGIWTSPAPLSATVNAGSAIAAVGTELFIFRGASSLGAYRVDTLSDTVAIDTDAAQTCFSGTAMTAIEGTLYAAFGKSKGFWRRIVWKPQAIAGVVAGSAPKADPADARCGAAAGGAGSWLLLLLLMPLVIVQRLSR